MVDAAATYDDGLPDMQVMQHAHLDLSTSARQQLVAYRRTLERALPGRVEDVILFGSYARGTARHDSDYDIAVILREVPSEEHMAIRQVLSDAAYDHVVAGTAISPIPVGRAFLQSASPLAWEIARDGISIG